MTPDDPPRNFIDNPGFVVSSEEWVGTRPQSKRTLGTWKVRLMWDPRDLWVGVYRDTSRRRTYVCLVPCLAIVIERTR